MKILFLLNSVSYARAQFTARTSNVCNRLKISSLCRWIVRAVARRTVVLTKRNFNVNSGTIQSENTVNRRNLEITEPKIGPLSSSRGYFVNPLRNLIQAPKCSHAKHRPNFQYDLSSTRG